MICVFLITFSLMVRASAQLENCRAPGAYEPGTMTACDPSTECISFCARTHLSLDFLCCEQDPWMALHFANPFFFMLAWDNMLWTIIFTFVSEVAEVFVLTIFQSFPVLFEDASDVETLASSYLADVVIQGGLGLVAGYVLHRLCDAPTLVPYVAARGWFIALSIAPLVTSVFLTTATTSSGARWGVMVQTALLLLVLWVVYPLVLPAWSTKSHRFAFFALAGVAVLAANVPVFVDAVWFINQWYQMWLFLVPVVALYVVIAGVVSCVRADYAEVAVDVGLFATLVWFWLWFAYAATGRTSVTLIVTGSIALVVAIIAFIVSATASPPTTPSGVVAVADATPLIVHPSMRRRNTYSFSLLS